LVCIYGDPVSTNKQKNMREEDDNKNKYKLKVDQREKLKD
jgi:hypothetical protein